MKLRVSFVFIKVFFKYETWNSMICIASDKNFDEDSNQTNMSLRMVMYDI